MKMKIIENVSVKYINLANRKCSFISPWLTKTFYVEILMVKFLNQAFDIKIPKYIGREVDRNQFLK